MQHNENEEFLEISLFKKMYHPGVITSFIYPSKGINIKKSKNNIYSNIDINFLSSSSNNLSNSKDINVDLPYLEISNLYIKQDPVFYNDLSNFFVLIKNKILDDYNIITNNIFEKFKNSNTKNECINYINSIKPFNIFINKLYIESIQEIDYFFEFIFSLAASIFSEKKTIYEDENFLNSYDFRNIIFNKGLFIHINTSSPFSTNKNDNPLIFSSGFKAMIDFQHETIIKTFLHKLLSNIGKTCSKIHDKSNFFLMDMKWILNGIIIDTQFPYFHIDNYDNIIIGGMLSNSIKLIKKNKDDFIKKDFSFDENYEELIINTSDLFNLSDSWKGKQILKKYYIISTSGVIPYTYVVSQGLFEYINLMSLSSYKFLDNNNDNFLNNSKNTIINWNNTVYDFITKINLEDSLFLFECEIPCFIKEKDKNILNDYKYKISENLKNNENELLFSPFNNITISFNFKKKLLNNMYMSPFLKLTYT